MDQILNVFFSKFGSQPTPVDKTLFSVSRQVGSSFSINTRKSTTSASSKVKISTSLKVTSTGFVRPSIDIVPEISVSREKRPPRPTIGLVTTDFTQDSADTSNFRQLIYEQLDDEVYVKICESQQLLFLGICIFQEMLLEDVFLWRPACKGKGPVAAYIYEKKSKQMFPLSSDELLIVVDYMINGHK